MDKSNIISSRIKASRLALGVTIDEIARRAGIGRSRWLNWEAGIRSPKLDTIPDIARVLKTSSSYIAGFTDHAGESSESWRYVVSNPNDEKEQKALAFDLDELEIHGIKPRNFHMIKVHDDSLSPELHSGDLAMIDTSINAIDNNGIYAIKGENDTIWLRWVRPEISGGYTIYTNNKNHFPDQVLSREDLEKLKIIGRYAGHWHWAAN